MKCSVCNANLPEGSAFCPYCGNKVIEVKKCKTCGFETVEDYVFCPMCGSKMDENNICPSCGAELDGDYVFCPICGENLGGKTPTQNRAVKINVKKNNTPGSRFVSKLKSHRKTIENILIAIVSLVILICSFFSIYSFDMNSKFEDGEYGDMGYAIEGKIEYRVSALELIDFAFFAVNLNAKEATKYLQEQSKETESLQEDLMKAFLERGNVETVNDIMYLTEDGCKEISSIISELPLLKNYYSQMVVINEDNASSYATQYVIAGLLCLLFIILSAVTLILSVVNIFIKKDLSLIIPFILLIGILVFTACLLGNNSFDSISEEGMMGGAYIAITVLLSVVLVEGSVMHIVVNKRIEWEKLTISATCILSSIIILCLMAAPVLTLTMYYDEVSENEDSETVSYEFEYTYTNSQLFNIYFDETKPKMQDVKDRFQILVENYKLTDESEAAYELIDSQIGLKGLLTNDIMYKNYEEMLSLLKMNMVGMLIVLGSTSALLAFGVGGMCGRKTGNVYHYVALALVFLFALISTIVPSVMQDNINSMDMIECEISSTGSMVAILIIAILGMTGCALAVLLKKKTLTFGSTASIQNKYIPPKEAQAYTANSRSAAIKGVAQVNQEKEEQPGKTEENSVEDDL